MLKLAMGNCKMLALALRGLLDLGNVSLRGELKANLSIQGRAKG